MPIRPAVEIHGVREVRRAFRQAADKDSLNAIKEAHRKAAELVVAKALPNVPVLTGKLKASVKALASTTAGRAKAGTASRLRYAAPIHYGWPAHNIQRHPFLLDALRDVRGDVDDIFLDALRRGLEILD